MTTPHPPAPGWPVRLPRGRWGRRLLDHLPPALLVGDTGSTLTAYSPQPVVLEGNEATVTPGLPRSRTVLPVRSMTVQSLEPGTKRPTFGPSETWRATLAGPGQRVVVLDGRWWRIVQLAGVAGWRYPGQGLPQRLVDLVTWPLQDRPSVLEAGAWTRTVLLFLGTAAVRHPLWRRPYDARAQLVRPERWLNLPRLHLVRDTGAATALATRRREVFCSAVAAGTLVRLALVELPLKDWRPVSLEPVRWGRTSFHAEERWRLVVGDEHREVTFEGGWLALAWLAHLGGWSMPAIPGRLPVLDPDPSRTTSPRPVRYRPGPPVDNGG